MVEWAMFNVQRVIIEWAMLNVQRVITPKVGKPELGFMCSARCLMVLYICVKFCENISNGIRVMGWTQNYEALTNGQTLKISDSYYIIPRHFLWRGIIKILSVTIFLSTFRVNQFY